MKKLLRILGFAILSVSFAFIVWLRFTNAGETETQLFLNHLAFWASVTVSMFCGAYLISHGSK